MCEVIDMSNVFNSMGQKDRDVRNSMLYGSILYAPLDKEIKLKLVEKLIDDELDFINCVNEINEMEKVVNERS